MGIFNNVWSDQMVFALGWSVLHSLWQGVLIACFTGVYLNWRPQMPARKRYLWAFFGLMAILLSSLLTFVWYMNQAADSVSSHLEPGDEPATTLLIFLSEPEAVFSLSRWFNRHLDVIVQCWAVGVALFGLRSIIGLGYAQRMKRRGTRPLPEVVQSMAISLASRLGIRQKVEVLESALLHTPVVIGALKPVILLPLGMINRLSPAEVEAVLAHELAHIRRHDYLLNLVQTLAETLLYFNPAVWYLSAVVRREREHSCDDLAMEVSGSALVYAKALVALQELSQPGPSMAMALSRKKGALWVRIQRILKPNQKKSSYLMERITLTGLILAVVFALNFQAARGASESDNLPVAGTFWKDVVFTMDSLPDGISRIVMMENGETMEAEYENGKLKQLKVNGRDVPAKEFPAYEAKLNKMLRESKEAMKNGTGNKTGTDQKKVTKVKVIQLNGDTESEGSLPQVFYMADSVVFISDSTQQWTIKSKESDGMRTIVVDGSTFSGISDSVKVTVGQPLRFKSSDLTYIKGVDTIHIKGMSPNGFISEDAISQMLEGIDLERLAEVRMLRRGPDSREIELIEIEGEKFEGKRDLKIVEGFDLGGLGSLNGMNLMQASGGGKAGIALERELQRDGMIENPEDSYTLELRENFLKVNGKKLPEGLARKYQKIYEQSTGMSLKNGSKVVIRK